MPRGMDERFEDPSGGENETNPEEATESASESAGDERNVVEQAKTQSRREGSTDQENIESSSTAVDENKDEPLNIREDWDSATIYVEPEQSEDIEVTFTRLKKQLKREGVILEKNKHFYRGIFEVAFDEYRAETKEKIRELARQDS